MVQNLQIKHYPRKKCIEDNNEECNDIWFKICR
ncbi:hypothetical protein T10_7925 [Trichinella papuae]|uniref:Uncharacterized protein n=1 Tax=Trichinella papuae TaxID=268474 RepID=A0A0V1LVU8_9BILA|nr:hypothetical protein T10_7925 [Trichinella papuae]